MSLEEVHGLNPYVRGRSFVDGLQSGPNPSCTTYADFPSAGLTIQGLILLQQIP